MLRFPIAATPPQVVSAPVAPGAAGRWRGGPAAITDPEAGHEAADSPGAGASPVAGGASLVAGDCLVWPLSLDATCAGESRRMFSETASGLGLPDDLIYDGMTMASELAANTLYALQNVQFEGAARRPVAGAPELWLYLRHAVGRWELVCKAFDSLTGWKCGTPPTPRRAAPGAMDGLARDPPAAEPGTAQVMAPAPGGQPGDQLQAPAVHRAGLSPARRGRGAALPAGQRVEGLADQFPPAGGVAQVEP